MAVTSRNLFILKVQNGNDVLGGEYFCLICWRIRHLYYRELDRVTMPSLLCLILLIFIRLQVVREARGLDRFFVPREGARRLSGLRG